MKKQTPFTEILVISLILLIVLPCVAIMQTLSSGEFYVYVSDERHIVESHSALPSYITGDENQMPSDTPRTHLIGVTRSVTSSAPKARMTDRTQLVVSERTKANVTGPPVDTTPPSILSVSMSPTEPTSRDEVVVRARIVDDICGVAQALLSYSTDGGMTWMNTTMTPVGEEYYEGSIPSQPANTEVRYKVYACDKVGNWAVSKVYSYVVKAAPEQPPERPPSPPPAEVGVPVAYYVIIGAVAGVAAIILALKFTGRLRKIAIRIPM